MRPGATAPSPGGPAPAARTPLASPAARGVGLCLSLRPGRGSRGQRAAGGAQTLLGVSHLQAQRRRAAPHSHWGGGAAGRQEAPPQTAGAEPAEAAPPPAPQATSLPLPAPRTPLARSAAGKYISTARNRLATSGANRLAAHSWMVQSGRGGVGELGYRPLRRGLTTGNPRPLGAGGARSGGSERACALGRPRRPPARAGDLPSGGRTTTPSGPRGSRACAVQHRPPLLCRRLEAGAKRLGDKEAREVNPRRAPGEAGRPFSPVAWMPLLISAPPLRNTTHSGVGPAFSQRSRGGFSLSLGPFPPSISLFSWC